jgi:hypothetical protein
MYLRLHIVKFTSKEVGCWWLTPIILPTWETDQEDHGSSPARANSFENHISKITRTKWTGSNDRVPVLQAQSPEFKPTKEKKNLLFISTQATFTDCCEICPSLN